MNTEFDVFISYRRKGGYDVAKHLFDLLRYEGYTVSFDLDTLRNGDFDTELLKRIDQCKDFIVILNPGAFDRSLDPTVDRNRDWLRIELAEALEKNKNVIPVMLAGFENYPESLPADIVGVKRKNGPRHSQEYFDEFYRKLKQNFMTSSPVKHHRQDNQNGSTSTMTLRIHPDEDCQIERYGEIIGTVRKNEYFPVSLRKGKHRLSFIPLFDPAQKEELEYTVKEIDTEDVYDVKFKGTDIFKLYRDVVGNLLGKTEQTNDNKEDSKDSAECEDIIQDNGSINTAANLGFAVCQGVSPIIVEGELADKVIKIMSVPGRKWLIAGGAIAVAIVAILAMPVISCVGPMGLVAEGLVLSAGGAGAVGSLGVAATVAAVSIGVGAKNKNAVNKLRKEYSLNIVSENKIILTKK